MSDKNIAYVDSGKLLNNYQAMLDARGAYKAKLLKWQSNTDTLTNIVQKAISQYERGVSTMTEKEKKIAVSTIQYKQKQLVDYQKSVQENARREDDQSTQLILNQVNAFLSQYGKRKNYDLILVANQSGNIAYAREGLDITDEVIVELNEEYRPYKR
ncbi:OmpH family outer membrane protein [Hymenobacter elongatus]|uniref:OmpH family outer membrane protein n=1 Tax=Hymenobacter elongatus TaxID=877208 RepID=UPI0014369C63|nr:OmpH family outer membrane protein [Hymenobacter elongatus]